MMTEHSQPLWGMPLNALEVQFVADDIENEHEVENENKNRDAAESTAPSDSEGLMSLIEEPVAHTEGNNTDQQPTIESEGGPEGGLVGPSFNSDLNTSKANAKRLVRELKQPYNEKGERVYCICRGVDDGKFMIQCDTCKDWYHGACVDISERQGRAITRYDCLQCVQAKNELIRNDIAHANTQSRRSNRSGQLDPSAASPPVVIAIPPVVGRKPPAQRAISIPNQQRRASNTATTPNIASSINSHTSKKSDPPKPVTPEPDVGPTSMAWIHDKTRSLVRKSFGEVLRTILDDFSAEGITPEHADADEKSADGAVPTEWLDVTELAGTMEDALFDLTSDGVKGLHRTCGDKYKAKFRSLQFNLKDKKNSTLRTRLLTGRLPASSLVKLEQRDLANDELRARAEAIRLQSIHDAIKPKIVDIVYKKTHKGDEVVGDASGLAAVAGGAAASTNSSAVPAFRTDNSKDDEDNLMSPVVPVAAVKQSGIAGIMAAVEAAKLAARVSVGPSKVESLDDLLSKVNSSSASAENLGEKRHAEAYYDEEPAKKSRHDQDVSSTINSGMGNSSNSWDHLAASDTWAHVDDGEGWIQSPGDDVADFKPSDSSSNTPTGSPKASPDTLENNGAIVWNGLVRMPQVGKFTGRCTQIAGKPVGSSKALWESILPPTVFIEGRIDVSRTQSYISQQRSSSSKEVIAVEFVPDTNVRDSPEEGGGAASEGGFQALMGYFVQKKRYAVIGQKYVHVRDMYLVPVKRGDAVPDMMTVLSKMSVVDKCNERDRLFGVLILDKAVFSSAAAVAKEAAVSKPGRSGASAKRGPPATGSAAKKVDAKPTPAPVPTTYPSNQAATSTPWSNLFPQTVQQQPPLVAALSNGMSPGSGVAAPPVTASNTSALALLMELTRQQQQQQQQQQQLHQTAGFSLPSAGTGPPMLVGGGLGLAGLLSQIQAAKQQQSNGGGSGGGGGNAYSFTGGSGTYQRQ